MRVTKLSAYRHHRYETFQLNGSHRQVAIAVITAEDSLILWIDSVNQYFPRHFSLQKNIHKATQINIFKSFLKRNKESFGFHGIPHRNARLQLKHDVNFEKKCEYLYNVTWFQGSHLQGGNEEGKHTKNDFLMTYAYRLLKTLQTLIRVCSSSQTS